MAQQHANYCVSFHDVYDQLKALQLKQMRDFVFDQ